jgi:hypothetical protein
MLLIKTVTQSRRGLPLRLRRLCIPVNNQFRSTFRIATSVSSRSSESFSLRSYRLLSEAQVTVALLVIAFVLGVLVATVTLHLVYPFPCTRRRRPGPAGTRGRPCRRSNTA